MEKQELASFIINCLQTYYRIGVVELTQLSIGADLDALIFKAEASDQKTYFVKLKKDHFHDASIEVLELLQECGIQQLIPLVETIDGKKTQQVDDFTLLVNPFVEGQDGFSRSLTDEQWIGLGKALRQVHEIDVPSSLKAKIRKEEFSPKFRDAVRSFYSQIEDEPTGDEFALDLWMFLQDNESIVHRLVDRAEQLSEKAQSQPLTFVLCHSDIHGGNVLIDGKDALYIVDWDHPIMAPKERDLMFVGGGVANVWNQPEEETLFYRGYGQTEIDWLLLAYYRHERIVEDIAIYCEELLLKPAVNQDRAQMMQHFMNMFESNGVVDIAFATDKHLKEGRGNSKNV